MLDLWPLKVRTAAQARGRAPRYVSATQPRSVHAAIATGATAKVPPEPAASCPPCPPRAPCPVSSPTVAPARSNRPRQAVHKRTFAVCEVPEAETAGRGPADNDGLVDVEADGLDGAGEARQPLQGHIAQHRGVFSGAARGRIRRGRCAWGLASSTGRFGQAVCRAPLRGGSWVCRRPRC